MQDKKLEAPGKPKSLAIVQIDILDQGGNRPQLPSSATCRSIRPRTVIARPTPTGDGRHHFHGHVFSHSAKADFAGMNEKFCENLSKIPAHAQGQQGTKPHIPPGRHKPRRPLCAQHHGHIDRSPQKHAKPSPREKAKQHKAARHRPPKSSQLARMRGGCPRHLPKNRRGPPLAWPDCLDVIGAPREGQNAALQRLAERANHYAQKISQADYPQICASLGTHASTPLPQHKRKAVTNSNLLPPPALSVLMEI
jgi:hypothetical protein